MRLVDMDNTYVFLIATKRCRCFCQCCTTYFVPQVQNPVDLFQMTILYLTINRACDLVIRMSGLNTSFDHANFVPKASTLVHQVFNKGDKVDTWIYRQWKVSSARLCAMVLDRREHHRQTHPECPRAELRPQCVVNHRLLAITATLAALMCDWGYTCTCTKRKRRRKPEEMLFECCSSVVFAKCYQCCPCKEVS